MDRLFNDEWLFYKAKPDVAIDAKDISGFDFKPVRIPHDWLIGNTDDLYEDSVGLYKKDFTYEKDENVKHIFLRFEGVYMDTTVYINGVQAFIWKYGYTTFTFEITDLLKNGINTVLVKVVYLSPNTRWYSGAGIYRNVWFIEKGASYFVPDKTYVSSKKTSEGDALNYELSVEPGIIVTNNNVKCRISLFENDENKRELFSDEKTAQDVVACGFSTTVENVHRWDIEDPYRYRLIIELRENGRKTDEYSTLIGFRDVKADPEKGFLLNGRKIKLNGTCEHHDLGALGAAVHKDAIRRRLEILREFGVNAIRTAHNPPAVELLDLCDEMGFIVMDEAFDMWERSKTEYDYARFFKEWSAKDVESWITRDRNHPSVCIWSIGNEIGDTVADAHGQDITRYLMNEVKKHDPKGNAFITLGSNYMPWENAQKCADILKIIGYNYADNYYDEHHKAHPDWVIFGSETASIVSSRGVYRFPFSEKIMSAPDEQCSSLGNSTTSWGAKSPEACVIAERDHDFSMGQFLWSGFDYIGEPTPYHTKNSYFGQFDTAGFAKDTAYFYRAAWTDAEKAPFVHLLPYWSFNEGQLIDVRTVTNCPCVELKVNGKSLGKINIDHLKGTDIVPTWTVPFEEGKLTAIAYDGNGEEVARDHKVSFYDSETPCLSVEQNVSYELFPSEDGLSRKIVIKPDHRELYFVDIMMRDKEGAIVENAMDYVFVETENCELLGLDNGDSCDYDNYTDHHRKLFNGCLGAIIKKTGNGDMTVTVTRDTKTVPLREIKILSETKERVLTPDNNGISFTAKVLPETANIHTVKWAAVTPSGIDVNFIKLNESGNTAVVEAIGDGEFLLRCYGIEKGKIRIISQIEMKAEGFGHAFTDPYSFVSAGLFERKIGPVGNGNDMGICTSYEAVSGAYYKDLDFGTYGSDEITLSLFTLDGNEYPIDIYEGDYEKGGKKITTVYYQKPSIWNVYQEETFKLPEKLSGLHSLSFIVDHRKIHFKGFKFTYTNPAYEYVNAGKADLVTGDSFNKTEDAVKDIGNNVTVTFDHIDLSEGAKKIRIFGTTDLDRCTIRIQFTCEDGEVQRMLEFEKNEGTSVSFRDIDIEELKGKGKLEFIFLPGSRFTLKGFCFIKG